MLFRRHKERHGKERPLARLHPLCGELVAQVRLAFHRACVDQGPGMICNQRMILRWDVVASVAVRPHAVIDNGEDKGAGTRAFP